MIQIQQGKIQKKIGQNQKYKKIYNAQLLYYFLI